MTSVHVVTGCTQGLGFYCVKTLAANPSVQLIVLACRNVVAAKKAADTIATQTKSTRERLVVLDEPCNLADIVSVRAYAAVLSSFLAGRKIRSLVNNAGIGGNPVYRKTKQDFEEIWGTNHLGHFLLTILLLPHMAENSRIVNVASEVHDPAAKTGLPDPGQHWPETVEQYNTILAKGEPIAGEDSRTSGSRRYSRSKLCNILFTNELARRLSAAVPHGVADDVAAAAREAPHNAICRLPAAQTVQVVAMNPGLMLDTGFVTAIAGGAVGCIAWGLSPIIRNLTPLGKLMRTAPQSGANLAQLAASTPAGTPGATAAYYNGVAVQPSSAFSLSKETVARRQAELWEHSVRWAAVTPQELAAAGF